MSRDRMTMAGQFAGVGFRQCMVARSERVRRWVKHQQTRAQRDPTDARYSIRESTFVVLEDIIEKCRRDLPWAPSTEHTGGVDGERQDSQRRPFDPARRVDFARFKHDFVGGFLKRKPGFGQINSSVAWTQIKSFIKGSIEAVLRWDPAFPQVSPPS